MTLSIAIGLNWEIGATRVDIGTLADYLDAVAATGTVRAAAAGAADAAFALRAVTENLAVDFIPVGFETYYFGGRKELATDPRCLGLLRQLTERLASHPGYASLEQMR